LSESFKTLTQYGSFDSLIIPEGSLPELGLAVQSTSKPELHHKPDQVLNGQALSATQLVPYFAFSEMAGLAIEVHTILLDDPTQSFDKEHIGILLKNLSKLGKNTQLFIGTHEIDEFKKGIRSNFNKNSYKILEIKDFKPESGPLWEMTVE
ncbi:hypothetical protein ACFLQJ_02355, partial [Calditrichota bacterium]